MKKKILNNLGLKLASLLIAVVIWFLVAQIDDPQVTVPFMNVPVTLTNTQLLEQQNKVYEILDNSAMVNVTIKAPKSVVNKLRTSDILAYADLTKLTDINTIAISYTIQNAEEGSIKSIKGNHDSVLLSVEEKSSKWVRVQVKTNGSVAENYSIMDTSLDSTQIEITGPKSVVEKISYAAVNVDVEGATAKMSMNVEPQLYDKDGKLIETQSLSKNVTSIHVTIEVLAVKEVPITYSIVGKPAEGYLATGEVTCSPQTIKIAGSATALAAVEKIVIPSEQTDLTDLTESMVRIINVKQLMEAKNVRLASGSQKGDVTIKAVIEPKVEKTCLLTPENVSVVRVPEDFEAIIVQDEENPEPCELRIAGLEKSVTELQSTVMGTIDVALWMSKNNVKELDNMVITVPVTVVLPGNVDKLNDPAMKIAISRRPTE